MSCDVGKATEGLENELCVTYVRAHSPILLSLFLRHRILTYVTWRAAHDEEIPRKEPHQEIDPTEINLRPAE